MLQSIKPLDVKTLMWATPVLLALLFAISIGCRVEPVVIERTVEVIREVPVEVVKEVVVEKEVVREVVVVVTVTPAPTAAPPPQPTPVVKPTPTPRVSEDYYVIFDKGLVEYWADFPSKNYYGANTGGSFASIRNSDLFLEYLLREGTITPEQKNTHDRDIDIKIDFDDFSVAVYKLLQEKGYDRLKGEFSLDKLEIERFLYHFDESLLDSGSTARTVVEPTPTPRPSKDYYVLIYKSRFAPDERAAIEFFADFPSLNLYSAETGGGGGGTSDPEFFLDYLVQEGVITSEEKRTYFRGGEIKVSLDDLSVPVYKLLQVKGYSGMDRELRLDKLALKYLLYYFDESLLDSDRGSSASSAGDGYVIIRDGSLETIVTDADGNTTRVAIDTVDAEEFLDYLLDQGRITVQQRDEYGRTNSLTLSLKDVKDAADFFDWAYSSDEGLYVGIDRDDVNYIRDELLPLFSFGD